MFRSRSLKKSLALIAALSVAACSSDDDDNSAEGTAVDNTPADSSDSQNSSQISSKMSFFVTSAGPGAGGNLGGLAGADAHCGNLADAVGVTGKTWRAYLSTTGADGINASERIGEGPWLNANGVEVAQSVEDLLSGSNNITRETAITESASIIGGVGDTPNRHDILTGTELNGLASTDLTIDTTCFNWTSSSTGSALVGHHDRMGGGANPTSWSTAHPSLGCSQSDLIASAGDGLFYCFATN